MWVQGNISGRNLTDLEKNKVQEALEHFILSNLQQSSSEEKKWVMYRVDFSKELPRESVDCLLELKTGPHEILFSRAHSPDPIKSFNRALSCLEQIVVESKKMGKGREYASKETAST